uniref:Uncharacterized protein n=1 Tax=Arundo donax TaxID=35708 RepID=A0A0A9CYH6_ARUDO
MLGIAPFTRTHKEAAAAANLMHSILGFPSTRATAKAEVKVSPAPVVSITSVAGIIGCLIGSSPSTNKADPCDASLTSTSLTPILWHSPAAWLICSNVLVGIPVKRASSVSFGLKMSTSLSSSPGTGASIPPASMIIGTPALFAACAACMLTQSGISLCSSSTPACRISSRSSDSTPADQPSMLAPPTMMMEF